MPRITKNSRCTCCNEIKEELQTMRESFDKLLHRLTNQITDLSREVAEALANKKTTNTTTNKRTAAERACSPETPAQNPLEFRIKTEAEMEIFDVGFNNDNDSDDELLKPQAKQSFKTLPKTNQPLVNYLETQQLVECNKSVDEELLKPLTDNNTNDPLAIAQRIKPNASKSGGGAAPERSHFRTQERVLPRMPFMQEQQFEDWNRLLLYDETLRERLRAELLQDVFEEPDKYIRHIWRALLKNEAAENYSYRGHGPCKKKAIRGYIFTDIFIECFLQRFPHMSDDFFSDRTMRFFHYAHENKRKMERARKKQRKEGAAFADDTSMSMDEPTIGWG